MRERVAASTWAWVHGGRYRQARRGHEGAQLTIAPRPVIMPKFWNVKSEVPIVAIVNMEVPAAMPMPAASVA